MKKTKLKIVLCVSIPAVIAIAVIADKFYNDYKFEPINPKEYISEEDSLVSSEVTYGTTRIILNEHNEEMIVSELKNGETVTYNASKFGDTSVPKTTSVSKDETLASSSKVSTYTSDTFSTANTEQKTSALHSLQTNLTTTSNATSTGKNTYKTAITKNSTMSSTAKSKTTKKSTAPATTKSTTTTTTTETSRVTASQIPETTTSTIKATTIKREITEESHIPIPLE